MGPDPIDQQTRAMTDIVNNICEDDQLETTEDNTFDPDNICRRMTLCIRVCSIKLQSARAIKTRLLLA